MRSLLTIAVFGCLTLQVQAQDSLAVYQQGIVERIDQTQQIRRGLYQLPALRPYQFKHSQTAVDLSYDYGDQELYPLQEGAGKQGVRFFTDSYQKQTFPGYTLWGKARYTNHKDRQVVFNETSDFDLVFPYVTADSVGGDLQVEEYQFAGGFAKQSAKWTWAAELGFQANLSHRKVDPRPKNNSTAIHVGLGSSYAISSKYLLGAHVDLQSYRQRNELNFVASLGRPNIYYFNGLGAYNSLLSGISEVQGDMLYALQGIGGRLTLAPKDEQGLFLEAGITQRAGKRTLPLSTAEANTWDDQVLNGKIGYFGESSRWRFGGLGQLALQTRKGVESLFNNNGGNLGYVKIAEISSYRYYNFDYTLSAYIGQKQWSIRPYAGFQQIKEQYISPFREQAVDYLRLGAQGQYVKPLPQGVLELSLNLQKQQVLQSGAVFNGVPVGSGIEDFLQRNYTFLTAEPFTVSGQVRYDFRASNLWKPYIVAHAQSATAIKQHNFSVTLGLLF